MHIHFIIHEHFEAPGAYEAWAKMNGHTLSYTRIYLAEPLPKHTDNNRNGWATIARYIACRMPLF